IWMKQSGKFPEFEGWQDKYGAFTYSIREKDMIINYIKNQKEHHKTENFYDEFKRLLIENGIVRRTPLESSTKSICCNDCVQPLRGWDEHVFLI
ncbi:MAG: hypothetical protein M3015_07915, partial [Bacteroidota bacterium]|nr:hypothetical protein [Bacteroidota bacterium]